MLCSIRRILYLLVQKKLHPPLFFIPFELSDTEVPFYDKKNRGKAQFNCVAKTLGLNFEDVLKDKLAIFEEAFTGSDLYKLMVGQATSNMPRKQRSAMDKQTKKKKIIENTLMKPINRNHKCIFVK